MTQAKTLPDVEGPIRAYLRALAITGIGTRVFLGVPERATYPLVDMTLLDGGVQPGESPLAAVYVSCSVWGGARQATAAAAWDLVSKLESTASGTPFGLTLVCMGASVVLGPLWRPDPADGRPRYIVDAQITVRPV